MNGKDIYKMKLHDSFYLEELSCEILRVASGWIYQYIDSDSEVSKVAFVPFDNRFQV